jgi:Domain of unknown function (DU1801)
VSDPGSILSRYEDAVRTLGTATREFLLTNLPRVTEEGDASANIIGYGFGPGYKGSVCVIIPSKRGIKLGFYKGSELPDPAHLLDGTGKVHRYVVIRSEKDLRSPALLSLLNLAATACRERLGSR